VPADATGLPPFAFEVSPLFGYDEDSFAASWSARPPKSAISAGTILA
jgi:UDP-N-acetylglucosamine/UDP-N-acetylgalactosamine diphosphorylase